MLTDEQFADLVGDRLHTEVADIRPAPDLAATVRRRYARRTLAVRGGIATALASVAAAVFAMTSAVAPVASGHGPPAGTTTSIDTVAYVTRQTEAALAKADQYVLHQRVTSAFGHTEIWSAGGQLPTHLIGYGADGRVNSETGVRATDGNTVTVLTVDPVARTWWSMPIADGRAKGITDPLHATSPEAVQAAIAAGTIQIVGHEQVGGRDTLHLRLVGMPVKDGKVISVELWVDATSYLIARQTTSVDGQVQTTTTYEWLPRTADNLAKLTLVPPAGYAHRPPNPEPTGNGVG